jgi:periplasmic copper chaperone A
MKRRLFLIALLSPRLAHAHSTAVGGIKIGHAWALPSVTDDGQAFMPILNEGPEADALIGARSDRCTSIELRSKTDEATPPANEFALLPGLPLAMRPTARHLRLVGLKAPLQLGEKIPLILEFLNAGDIEVTLYVEHTPGE